MQYVKIFTKPIVAAMQVCRGLRLPIVHVFVKSCLFVKTRHMFLECLSHFSLLFVFKYRLLRGLWRELPRGAVKDSIKPALCSLERPQQQVGPLDPRYFNNFPKLDSDVQNRPALSINRRRVPPPNIEIKMSHSISSPSAHLFKAQLDQRQAADDEQKICRFHGFQQERECYKNVLLMIQACARLPRSAVRMWPCFSRTMCANLRRAS